MIGRYEGVKGNDVDKEGVCDGEGSKRFVFLSVASFGSLLLFLRKGGGTYSRGYMTYDLSTENIIIKCSALLQPVS